LAPCEVPKDRRAAVRDLGPTVFEARPRAYFSYWRIEGKAGTLHGRDASRGGLPAVQAALGP